jgi:hypothetical protein
LQQPFLHDHRIDGTSVLPGVMGVEAFAEAALALLPGWSVQSVENVEFLAPFKFYRDEPRTVTVNVQIQRDGEMLVAACRLTGSRLLPNQTEPQTTTHFTGTVRLAKAMTAAVQEERPAPSGDGIDAQTIYRIYFHGPAYQVLDRVWTESDRALGEMKAALPPNHQPPELPLVTMPRHTELFFQTAGIHEIATTGRMGLPLHIDRVTLRQLAATSEGRTYAVITARENGAVFDGEVVDAAGHSLVSVEGYRTVALPGVVDTEPFRTGHLVGA